MRKKEEKRPLIGVTALKLPIPKGQGIGHSNKSETEKILLSQFF
jgi:hypothetical protein